MFTETAELYDALYRSFKDYRSETLALVDMLRELAPDARSLLDVACGTGEHALYLARDHGYQVHGLDIEPTFVEIARAKVPGARFSVGDMAAFDLAARFDVVLCLFSSIGYLCDIERVTQALARFRAHAEPGGFVLVEPWFAPDEWRPGSVYLLTAETDGLQVARMSHSTKEDSLSRIDFHYLVGRPGGVEHLREQHVLGLFTSDQMLEAFDRAGLPDVRHDPVGITGRGLYVARASG